MQNELFQQLQSVTGELAKAMRAVNIDCQGSSMDRPPERRGRIQALLDMLGDTDQVRAVSQAVGNTRWPGAYGESPYDDLMTVLRCASRGEPLPCGATRVMQELHQMCFDRFAPPAARSRWAMDERQRQARFPRLLRAMQHGALLTVGEADATLRVLLGTHPHGRGHAPASCEAVAHFGGCLKVVRAARRWRLRFLTTSRRSAKAWA